MSLLESIKRVGLFVFTTDENSTPVALSVTNPLPVALRAVSGQAITDRSGTITAGSTSQQVAAANTARRYFVFQNHSDTDMWINFGVTAVATQPSVKIFAGGGAYEPLVAPTEAVHVICATSGKAFTCKEA
jgi:hypothetical protein